MADIGFSNSGNGQGAPTPPRHGRRRPTTHAFGPPQGRRGWRAFARHDGGAARAIRYLTILALLLAFILPAAAQTRTKMVVGTGVDPSFGQLYVGKTAGIFEKNGLDVQVNLGPSGSAMIAFVVGNQIQAALGAEQAGIQDHNLDPNVVITAESAQLIHFYGLVARHVPDIASLKGKKIGIDQGSSSLMFWLALVKALNLDPKDYKIIQVEPPEMIAALERGDIDAFGAWEPWVTKALAAVPDTKNLRDNDGIIVPRDYVYMNKGWAEQNKAAAAAFMKSLSEAKDFLVRHPAEAAKQISGFLKLDAALTESLLPQVKFEMMLNDDSVAHMKEVEAQIKQIGKLQKPVDYAKFVYPDPLKAAEPESVNLTAAQ
jgi:NitT/TauT family transport system substrate-binding protein